MSSISISTLPKLKGPQLAALLLTSSLAPRVAVVDVRDSDYLGGHIRGSLHYPSGSLDVYLPELLRTLRQKDLVVFHCMLSTQRGPSAALKYARERERVLARQDEGGLFSESEAQQRSEKAQVEDAPEEWAQVMSQRKAGDQVVALLEGGFEIWQREYGRDERLTEAYRPEIWEDDD